MPSARKLKTLVQGALRSAFGKRAGRRAMRACEPMNGFFDLGRYHGGESLDGVSLDIQLLMELILLTLTMEYEQLIIYVNEVSGVRRVVCITTRDRRVDSPPLPPSFGRQVDFPPLPPSFEIGEIASAAKMICAPVAHADRHDDADGLLVVKLISQLVHCVLRIKKEPDDTTLVLDFRYPRYAAFEAVVILRAWPRIEGGDG